MCKFPWARCERKGRRRCHGLREEPESVWQGWHGGSAHSERLTELGRPREARSLGARLAMTEAELDPELEGNGVGKWHDINQRGGVTTQAFEKYRGDSSVVAASEGQGWRLATSKGAVQGPGGMFEGPHQGRIGGGHTHS